MSLIFLTITDMTFTILAKTHTDTENNNTLPLHKQENL